MWMIINFTKQAAQTNCTLRSVRGGATVYTPTRSESWAISFIEIQTCSWCGYLSNVSLDTGNLSETYIPTPRQYAGSKSECLNRKEAYKTRGAKCGWNKNFVLMLYGTSNPVSGVYYLW